MESPADWSTKRPGARGAGGRRENIARVHGEPGGRGASGQNERKTERPRRSQTAQLGDSFVLIRTLFG